MISHLYSQIPYPSGRSLDDLVGHAFAFHHQPLTHANAALVPIDKTEPSCYSQPQWPGRSLERQRPPDYATPAWMLLDKTEDLLLLRQWWWTLVVDTHAGASSAVNYPVRAPLLIDCDEGQCPHSQAGIDPETLRGASTRTRLGSPAGNTSMVTTQQKWSATPWLGRWGLSP